MSEMLRRVERRIAAVPLPGRAVSAVLLVAFIAFGAFVGRVTRPKAAPTRAIEVKMPIASTTHHAVSQPPAPEPTPSPAAAKGEEEELPEEEFLSEEEEARGAGGGGGSGGSEGDKAGSHGKASPKFALDSIKHVFLIVLDDSAYAEVFGPESNGRYLAHTLEQQGKLLERFYAVAHQQLPDGIALISGQGPTAATAEDCPVYEDVAPAKSAADGQVLGNGCVYPSSVQTVAGQLTAKHLGWRAYIQELGGGGNEASASCTHPALGAEDPTAALGMPAEEASTSTADSADGAEPGSAAASSPTDADEGLAGTFRDPFVYFHSIIDAHSCAKDVVGVDRLKHDLKSAKQTPSFSYIAPDLCEDGSSKLCAPGGPAGMAAADGFLKTVVPEILAAPAYKQNGLLVITVDEAPSTGELADSSSCCGQPSYPNLPSEGSSISGAGGGEVGALLLSPFVKSDGISQETYNDFSLLRTIEEIFSLKPLGYAGSKDVKPFSTSLFSVAG
ncbi:MAG TPA: alkaline phosphatase family protein [Solirubrobacteraceae bacterium]|jgi:hypothetical protein